MIESKTSATASAAKSKKPWVEYVAALWAFVFAFLHVAWAFGWYIGLDERMAREAFARQWFFTYNLIAAGLCFVAVAAALAFVQRWGSRLPRLLVGTLVSGCAAILILRGGAAVVRAIYLTMTGGVTPVLSFWDWWFCLGAGFFAASAWRFWRK